MYFNGNSSGTAYSVRTNWNISGHQACEVIFTVDHSDNCADQGICFYNDGQSPNWNWDPDQSRIAFQTNCPVPYVYGTNKFVNNSGEYYGLWNPDRNGSDVLENGIYTFKVTYNPAARTVTAVTYEGSDTSGTVVDTIVLHEKLMDGGPYRIGFDADNDGVSGEGGTAYFKSLTINVYEANGISDNTELNNQLSRLKTGYSQVTDLVENSFLFSDDADIDNGDGDGIDPNFDQLGLGDVIFIQSDGKIVVGGQSGLNDYSRNLRRINVDGTEDESFMPPVFTGGCCDQGYVRDVAQQSDGRLIVVGHFEQVNQFDEEVQVGRIVRLHTDGTLDEFSCVPGASGYVYVVKLLSDDRILIGGSFDTYDGINCSRIALLDSDGIVDETFAGNVSLNGAVHEIEVTGDYSGGTLGIYVGGQFTNKIIKLNEDGTTDESFNVGSGFSSSIGGANPRVSSIKVQSDNKVLVGHWFQEYDGVDCGKGLTLLNSDGTRDNNFLSVFFDDVWVDAPDDNDHRGGVNTIALQDDGKIIVGGWFDNANGLWQSRIARLEYTYPVGSTSIDTTFDIGFGFSYNGWNWGPRVQDIKLDADGNVYVAGSFTDYNHAARFQYAKLDTNGALQEWSVLPAFKQMGINDGMDDMYDGANYLNTNLTLPYIYIKCYGGDDVVSGGEGACGCPEAGVICGLESNSSIPSTHTQAWDDDPEQDFYDESRGLDETGSDDVEWPEYRYLPVCDSHVMVGDGYFGDGSSYFTAMFPGMFVLAANNINITQFSITGNIGSDGEGVDAADIYPIKAGSQNYTAYFKTNYGAGDPSINHIIIVDGDGDGIEQFYDPTSRGDEHCITGLGGKTKLFFLCLAKANAVAITTSEATNVATKFLEVVGLGSCVSSTYELDLSPDHPELLPNYKYDGEGNLDTSIVESDGKRISIQRTTYLELTDDCGNKRVISGKDGGSLGSVGGNFIKTQEYFKNPPVSQSVNYTQSELYSGADMVIATKDTMINGSAAESRATGTGCGGFQYIQIDLNGVYSVKGVVIGCDWFGPNNSDTNINLSGLVGDWGKEYTENLNVEYSTDGVNYTFLFNTGIFEEPIQTYNTNVKARYIRIVRENNCLCVTEFYAI